MRHNLPDWSIIKKITRMMDVFMRQINRSLILVTLLMTVLLAAIFAAAPAPVSFAQQGITPTITPLPSSTPLPTATPFVPVPPTPLPASATPAFCLTPLDFKVGDTVVLIPGISVRTAPNPDSALIINYQDRREFLIAGGPVCTGGFNFWNIQGHGINGWVAEGRGTRYWLFLVRRSGEPELPCLTPLKLGVGERFDILNNVRIREEPSLTSLTRTVVSAGSFVTILSGPKCAEGYNWWQVRAVVLGVTYEGWLAEGNRFGDIYVNVPPEGDGTVCDFPLHLDIGQRVQVMYNDGKPKNLRNAPDTSATILYELVEGVPMIIIGGPLCADTYNWWQVSILSSMEVVGWLAEGGPANYWIGVNELPGRGQEPNTPVP
jgi:hypothetical protein